MSAFVILCRLLEIELSVGVFRSFYVIRSNKDNCFCTLYARISCDLSRNTLSSWKGWKHGCFAISLPLELGSWPIKTQWSGTFSDKHLEKLFELKEKTVALLSECRLVDIRRLIFSDLIDRCMFGHRGILSLLADYSFVLILTKL